MRLTSRPTIIGLNHGKGVINGKRIAVVMPAHNAAKEVCRIDRIVFLDEAVCGVSRHRERSRLRKLNSLIPFAVRNGLYLYGIQDTQPLNRKPYQI